MDISYLIVIILFAIIVVTFGYWLSRLSQKEMEIRRTMTTLYFFEGISLIAIAAILVFVYLDPDDVDAYGRWWFVATDWSPIFIIPLQYFMFITAARMKKPGTILMVCTLAPLVVYQICVIALHILVPWEVIKSTTWMFVFDTVVFSILVVAGIFSCLVAYCVDFYKYKNRMSNYFSNVNNTDYVVIIGLIRVAVVSAMGLYFTFVFGFDMLQKNIILAALLMLIPLYAINYLGYRICSIKGITVPDNIDWSRNRLTNDEVSMIDERLQRVEAREEARLSTVNIDDTLKKWIDDSKMYYLKSGITINDVSEQTHISAKLISAYLNKTLNINFNSWINIHRIGQVKTLLMTTNQTLEEIAHSCGFTDRSALTRVFTKSEGMTPKEFRNRNGRKE